MKFSFEAKIRTGIKSSSFFNLFFSICHGVLFYNICSYIRIAFENPEGQRTNFILYHACYDPKKNYSSSIFTAMPVSTLFQLCTNCILIGGNFYLYRFLKSNSDKRKGRSDSAILCFGCFRISSIGYYTM